MRNYILLLFLLFLLTSCARRPCDLDIARQSYLAQDYPRAFRALWQSAKNHDARALYAMGYFYYYGLGTDKDQDLGRQLIARAASGGYPPAVIGLKMLTEQRHNQYLPLEHYVTKDMVRQQLLEG